MAAGILVIISGKLLDYLGFVNTYLLAPKQMGEKRKLWVGFHHLKLLTAIILFSPVIKIIPISL